MLLDKNNSFRTVDKIIDTLSGLSIAWIENGFLDILFNIHGNLEIFLFGSRYPFSVKNTTFEIVTLYNQILSRERCIGIIRDSIEQYRENDLFFLHQSSRFSELIRVLCQYKQNPTLHKFCQLLNEREVIVTDLHKTCLLVLNDITNIYIDTDIINQNPSKSNTLYHQIYNVVDHHLNG